MLHGLEPERERLGTGGSPARRVIDGVRVAGDEIWSFLAREDDDPEAWLFGSAEPVTLCRRVGPDGTLELGFADPDRDDLVSGDVRERRRG